MRRIMIISIIVLSAVFMLFKMCNRVNNGIHGIGKDAVLIEGEVITINWAASDETAERALRKWRELR